jgi:hypothetical protein
MQIGQRDADAIIYIDQKDTGAAMDLSELEIDFEFPFTESKNSSRSEIRFEIKDILNPNSDAGKLNKKPYLMFRLYAAISV